MTQLTAEIIEAYLARYGWTFTASGLNEWTTGFQGEQRLYPLTIRLSDTCVSFEVRPLVDLPLDPVAVPELARELLELNGRMQLVKVGLTPGGEVCMSCQVLAAGFDYDMLSRILGILGYYAEEVAPDILSRVAAVHEDGRPALLC